MEIEFCPRKQFKFNNIISCYEHSPSGNMARWIGLQIMMSPVY